MPYKSRIIERTGVLPVPGVSAFLADAVEGLLLDPARAARLRDAGRETVRGEFALPGCTASLLRAIDAENEPMDTRVREAIARCAAPDLDGRTVAVRAVHDRRDSLVAELLLAGSPPRELVLKSQKDRPGQSAQPGVRARREYRVLRFLHGEMGEEGAFGVPCPHHLCEGGAAILMTRCSRFEGV